MSSKAERYIDQFHYKKYVKDFIGRRIRVNWKHFESLDRDQAMYYILKLSADEHGEINSKKLKLYPKISK
jgi:hypothetical protein